MSAGIQVLVVRSAAPPPHLPKSTHPPLYPLLGAFWVAALHRGRWSGSLEPLDIGVGGLTHLAPLPGADGAAPTPMGAGTPSGPCVSGKGSCSPAAPDPSWLRMRCARRDPLAPGLGGDV